ncbi:MAG: hypothetical protein FWH07_02925 [Oscillospiraceae bacterium]|nr:hypothetical protein [Oscillospiraceae bacterium]
MIGLRRLAVRLGGFAPPAPTERLAIFRKIENLDFFKKVSAVKKDSLVNPVYKRIYKRGIRGTWFRLNLKGRRHTRPPRAFLKS